MAARSRYLVLALAILGAGMGALVVDLFPAAILFTMPIFAAAGWALSKRLRSPTLLAEIMLGAGVVSGLVSIPIIAWLDLPGALAAIAALVGSVLGVPVAIAVYRAQFVERARAGSLVRSSDERAVIANVATEVAVLALVRADSRMAIAVAAGGALIALVVLVLDGAALREARAAQAALAAALAAPDAMSPPASAVVRVDWGLGDGERVAERAPDDPYRGQPTVAAIAHGSERFAWNALVVNLGANVAKLVAALAVVWLTLRSIL
jgi:hypothetical protein